MPFQERQRAARPDWVLMRVTTVALVLVAAAFTMIIFVLIATHI
jgi:succinate dehydrogenase hydrophobic anchor subunit